MPERRLPPPWSVEETDALIATTAAWQLENVGLPKCCCRHFSLAGDPIGPLHAKLVKRAQSRVEEGPLLIMARLDRSRPARMALALFGLVVAGILGLLLE